MPYQSVDLATNQVEIHRNITEDWHVTVADTGAFATTGQRVSLAQKYIEEAALSPIALVLTAYPIHSCRSGN